MLANHHVFRDAPGSIGVVPGVSEAPRKIGFPNRTADDFWGTHLVFSSPDEHVASWKVRTANGGGDGGDKGLVCALSGLAGHAPPPEVACYYATHVARHWRGYGAHVLTGFGGGRGPLTSLRVAFLRKDLTGCFAVLGGFYWFICFGYEFYNGLPVFLWATSAKSSQEVKELKNIYHKSSWCLSRRCKEILSNAKQEFEIIRLIYHEN